MTDELIIRPAQRDDAGTLFTLVQELAEYERASGRVVGSEEMLAAALFDAPAIAEAVIAETGGEPAGFALFFTTFSTWLCQRGMWLEDLFVRPEHRGSGVGRELLAHLARLGVDRGYGRLEWSALDWNTPAHGFYDRLGATRMDDWLGFRLEGDPLRALAESSPR